MQLDDAFRRVGSLSSEQRREVLADPFADDTMRGVAALLIAKRRDLTADQKVSWLLQSWDSATLNVRKWIVEGLGDCPSPQGVAFLKEKLSEPELRSAALKALAKVKEEAIVPLCEQLIRSGTECECRSAVGALMTLGTPNAIALIEAALQSAPSESCRQRAAFLLALNGISTGELLLERKLAAVQPLQASSQESEPGEPVEVDSDFLHTATALAEINNKIGLLALKQLLDILETNPHVDRQYVMVMMSTLM